MASSIYASHIQHQSSHNLISKSSKMEAEIQQENHAHAHPEIIEIDDDRDHHHHDDNSASSYGSRDDHHNDMHDVYVAVGKDDMDVLKWVLDHHVMSRHGARVCLVHVYPPLSTIQTPVGRLSVSQLSAEQLKIYANQEYNRRAALLHKYIQLCAHAKVTVETVLIESSDKTKAILDLIQVLNITSLIMGTKHPLSTRRLKRGPEKGVYVKRNAPEYCEVTLIYVGKKNSYSLDSTKETSQISKYRGAECMCFPVKF